MSVIKLKKTYPVSKEKLWAYLIEDELLSSWCMPSKGFELRRDCEFKFEMPSSIFWDGKFHNTVTGFRPYGFLTYECVMRRPAIRTTVKWTLTEENGETTLELEHSGFKSKDWLTRIMLFRGWKKMLNRHLYSKLV